jgi:Flp pilus assembly protein TadD
MRSLLCLAAALAFTPVAAQQDMLGLIDLALTKGRLVQADDMIRLARREHSVADATRLDELEGRLALAQGRAGDAFEAFGRVLSVEQENCRAMEGAGLAALRLERIHAANLRLHEAVAHCPERWRAWNALGVIADRVGNWSESTRAYGAARESVPDDVMVINNMGYSLILQGRFAEAEALLREGLLLAPDDSRLLNNLDLAMVGANEPLAARDLPENATAPDPAEQALRLNNAGFLAYLLGKDDVAKGYFEQALETSQVHYERAQANLDLVKQGAAQK